MVSGDLVEEDNACDHHERQDRYKNPRPTTPTLGSEIATGRVVNVRHGFSPIVSLLHIATPDACCSRPL
jgi:hypothetical protein